MKVSLFIYKAQHYKRGIFGLQFVWSFKWGHHISDYISFLKRSLQLVKTRESIKRLELHITNVDLDDHELDADDVAASNKYVSSLTRTLAGGRVVSGARGQDDFRSQDGGMVTGQHGSFQSTGMCTQVTCTE